MILLGVWFGFAAFVDPGLNGAMTYLIPMEMEGRPMVERWS